jgi:hypothetical protein
MNRSHEDNSCRTIPSYLPRSRNFSFTLSAAKCSSSCESHFWRGPTAELASDIYKMITYRLLLAKSVSRSLFLPFFKIYQAFCASKAVQAAFPPASGCCCLSLTGLQLHVTYFKHTRVFHRNSMFGLIKHCPFMSCVSSSARPLTKLTSVYRFLSYLRQPNKSASNYKYTVLVTSIQVHEAK